MSVDQTLKILIVEDTVMVRKLEIKTLNEIGFSNIIEAGDGDEAITKLQEIPGIGLILSDWNMPKKTGYELLVWVRSQDPFRHIPFIMVTSQAEKRQVDKAVEAGVNGFISKPFDMMELKEVIEQALESEKSALKPETKKPTLTTLEHVIKSAPRKTASGRIRLKAAHIQITDHLILGVLKHLIDHGQLQPRYFELETWCLPGWNPVQQALQKGEADVGFVLAPIAMDLFGAGVPIRLTLFAHKNGSICVRNAKGFDEQSLQEYFKGKTFFIPHLLSVHHMLSNMFLRQIGLNPGLVGKPDADVFFEVVPPVKMQEFMVKTEAAGFTVAEPLGAKAIASGEGRLMFLSSEIWNNHPCCIVAVQDAIINAHPDAVQEFSNMLVHAGQFIAQHPGISSGIGADFLDPDRTIGLNVSILEHVLKDPKGITTDDLFPVIEDLDRIQRYMTKEMGIGTLIDVEKFVDLQFAEIACKDCLTDRRISELKNPATVAARISTMLPEMIQDNIRVYTRPSRSIFEIVEESTSIMFRISSEMKMADRIIPYAQEFIRQFDFSPLSKATMVLRELLKNAIEHGNKSRIEKMVICTIVREQNTFKIIIKDEGQGFDYHRIVLRDSSQQHRGYRLVNALSDSIQFSAKGNEVTVTIRIDSETTFIVKDDGSLKIIQPSGSLTASVADKFRMLLTELIEQGYFRFRFDLTMVSDMDSITLGVFVLLAKILSKRGVQSELEIVNASREIVNLFNLSGLDKVYKVR